MISDIEHFFIYLLAICMFSLEKCLFNPLFNWVVGLFFVFVFVFFGVKFCKFFIPLSLPGCLFSPI